MEFHAYRLEGHIRGENPIILNEKSQLDRIEGGKESKIDKSTKLLNKEAWTDFSAEFKDEYGIETTSFKSIKSGVEGLEKGTKYLTPHRVQKYIFQGEQHLFQQALMRGISVEELKFERQWDAFREQMVERHPGFGETLTPEREKALKEALKDQFEKNWAKVESGLKDKYLGEFVYHREVKILGMKYHTVDILTGGDRPDVDLAKRGMECSDLLGKIFKGLEDVTPETLDAFVELQKTRETYESAKKSLEGGDEPGSKDKAKVLVEYFEGLEKTLSPRRDEEGGGANKVLDHIDHMINNAFSDFGVSARNKEDENKLRGMLREIGNLSYLLNQQPDKEGIEEISEEIRSLREELTDLEFPLKKEDKPEVDEDRESSIRITKAALQHLEELVGHLKEENQMQTQQRKRAYTI